MRIRKLSPIQQAWTLMNIGREKKRIKDEEFSKIRLICSAVNPMAAKEMFMPKEETVNIGFKEQIEKQVGRRLTDEEFEEINSDHTEQFDEVTSTKDEES